MASEDTMDSKYRVVVVEDDEQLRLMYADALEFAGCSVDPAGNLEDGLARIDARTYHVAVVDLMLGGVGDPTLHGLEVLDRIRELDEGTRSVVISMQWQPQTAADTVLVHGASRYIAKDELSRRGVKYLVDEVLGEAEATSIRKYGDAGGLLKLLAGYTPVAVWEDQYLRVLKPTKRHAGLKSFLECLCAPLLPLMPEEGASAPLSLDKDSCAGSGRFWSKALGQAVELVVVREDSDAEGLAWAAPIGRRLDESLPEPVHANGLVGHVLLLPDATRSDFVERISSG
jgi:CheY-like chemotaxis protein